MEIAPLPTNESARLDALRQCQILDTPPEEAFDDLTQLAAHMCGTPIALVSLVDANRQWFKSKVGIDAPETPRDIAFCAHAIHQTDIFVVPDTTKDQRFADNPLVTTDPNIRFYAGMPLITSSGQAMGTLCVIDRAPRELTPSQMESLRRLGRQVVQLLELRRHVQERSQMVETLCRSEERFTLAALGSQYGMWDWNISTNEVYLSPRWKAIRDYDDDELPNSLDAWFSRIHPEDKDRFVRSMEEHHARRVENFKEEYRTQCKDGSYKWVQIRGQAAWDDTGRPVRMAGSESDITTRKQIDLVESIEHAMTGILAVATTWQEVRSITLPTIGNVLHSAVGLYWEYVVEDKVLRCQEAWTDPSTASADFISHSQGMAFTRNVGLPGRTWETGQPQWIENVCQDPNFPRRHAAEKSRLVSAYAFPIFTEDRVWGVMEFFSQRRETFNAQLLGVLSTIGSTIGQFIERIETQKRMVTLLRENQLILASVGEGIFGIDRNGRISFLNPTASNLLGYSIEELRAVPSHETLHHTKPDGSRHLRENCPICLTTTEGTPAQINDDVFWRKDGTSFPIEYSSTPMRNDSGDVTGAVVSFKDITQRKQTELMLAEANQRLQIATESSGIGVWEYAIRENRLVWDDRMIALYGYTTATFPGSFAAWTQRLHHEDKAQAEQALHDAIESHNRFDTEFRLILPDNTIRHIKTSAVTIYDEHGAPTRMIGVNYDISTRKEAESAVAASRAHLQSILNATALSIISTDLHGVITLFNVGAERMLGYRADEMVGKQTAAILHAKEEVAARNRALIAQFGRPIEGLNTFVEPLKLSDLDEQDSTYVRKDGSRLTVNLSITSVLNDRGVSTGYLGIASDITARKQAEEQFRLVVESAPNGMLMVNQDGAITLINAQVELLFGYNRQELLGRPIECLIPERFRPKHPAQRTAFFQTPTARSMGSGRDLFGLRKDGTEFPVEIGLNPIETPEGLRVLASVVDVTARKQTADKLEQAAMTMECRNLELAQANDLAMAATKAKSEFLSMMSHEIRTPMNAIIGMADLLQETSLSQDQQEYVHRFSRAANSLLDLINDILDLSKIESGHLDFESIDFDLREVIERTGELIAVRAHAKKLELIVHMPPDIPDVVTGDPTRLRQVLVNLIGNAIKFTERGQIVIRVESAKPGLLNFSVSDTGIGIPEDKIGSLFQSFMQVDSSTTRKYGGTGLGLNISKRLVELMGGTITVDSLAGVGTTFDFTVPLQTALRQEPRPCLPHSALQGMRCLIVDDNEVNRLVIREILSKSGVVITEEEDGPSALATLRAAQAEITPFQLAILDCRMPGMDGFQLAEAIRQTPEIEGMPLLMLTSDMRLGDAERARTVGLKGYINKPIGRTALIKAVTDALVVGAPSAQENQGQAVSMAPASAVPDILTPLRILLVDDLEDNRDVVALFLKDTPYRIDMAENGAIAVEKFHTALYDLVLMDIQMPVMDGLQATTAIRQWERAQQRIPTPIVALTANAFKEELDKSLAAGCTAHVTKPIKKKTLLATIAEHTHRPSQQAA